MTSVSITLSVPTILRDQVYRAIHGLGEIDESRRTVQGVDMAEFTMFDVTAPEDIEQQLIDLKIPYSLQTHAGFDVEGSMDHFRIHEDGTEVSTSYNDSSHGRMVSLDDLIEAHNSGSGAVVALINKAESEHPVLNWMNQIEALERLQRSRK